jgi:hypothetical protein
MAGLVPAIHVLTAAKRSYTGTFLKPVLARRGVERKQRTEAVE